MSPQSKSNPSRALDGVHGVQVVPHSPFALEEISEPGTLHRSSCDRSSYEANQFLLMQRVWQQRPACLRPIRCCLNDDESLGEMIANVLTSLPFIALGIQAPRKNLNCKLYANSLIGVGIASGLYHSSRGRPRKYLRWVDYTMIATATVCLSRALRNENPKLLMAASAFLLPIQPLMVSAVHTGMMEVAFAKRALDDPDLRLVHNVHKMSSLLGGALFIADDVFPRTPFIHAAWHLAAAVGVGTFKIIILLNGESATVAHIRWQVQAQFSVVSGMRLAPENNASDRENLPGMHGPVQPQFQGMYYWPQLASLQ